MDFNKLVIEKLLPLFEVQGFDITEEYKNFFRFRSDLIEATISYNELDKTSLFEIGKKGKLLHPVNDNIIRQAFGLEIKVNQVTKEEFVNNIALFLKNEGAAILKGKLSDLAEIKNLIEKESEAYTSKILQDQNLTAANSAWNDGNYREFIRLIDQTDKDKLPASYLLKYKIANQRL